MDEFVPVKFSSIYPLDNIVLQGTSEVYRQRLLRELSNAYNTGVVLQFDSVTDGYDAEETPCELYGPISRSRAPRRHCFVERQGVDRDASEEE